MPHISPVSTIDTRVQKRFQADVSIKVFSKLLSGSTQGRSSDLSESGISFYAPIDLPVGGTIQLHFSLPHCRTPFGVEAIIRNVNGFRYGAEFVRLSERERAEIARVCKILKLQQT